MKGKIIVICLFCLSLTIAAGCQKRPVKPEDAKTITIMYGAYDINQSYVVDAFKENMEYANEVMLRKGYPYKVEVQFAEYDKARAMNKSVPNTWYFEQLQQMKKEDKDVDLIFMYNYASLHTQSSDVIKQELIHPLDAFYETEKGKEIYKAFPEVLMDSMKYHEVNYFLPGYIALEIVDPENNSPYFHYNKKIAESVNIDINTWDEKFWEHKDDLVGLMQPKDQSYHFIDTLYFFLSEGSQLTPILYSSFINTPFGVDEQSGEIKCIYEDIYFQKGSDVLNEYVNNYYNPMDSSVPNGTSFLRFFSLEDLKEEDRKSYMPVYKDYYTNIIANSTFSIASWTKQLEDVEEFLYLINTDKELSTAFCYGEEGIDYFNKDGVLYGDEEMTSDFIGYSGLGNPFIIPTCKDVADRSPTDQTIYDKVNQLKQSKALGFSFDNMNVKEEMKEIEKIYTELDIQDNKPEDLKQALDYKSRLKKLNDAGLQKVLNEMNAQFQQFQNEKK